MVSFGMPPEIREIYWIVHPASALIFGVEFPDSKFAHFTPAETTRYFEEALRPHI
jgi:hypothetical protein